MDIPEYRDSSGALPAVKRTVSGGATVLPVLSSPTLDQTETSQGHRGRATENDAFAMEKHGMSKDGEGPSGNRLTKGMSISSYREMDEVVATVGTLEANGRAQNARLEGYTIKLGKKLQKLKIMNEQMEELRKSAKDLVLNLGAADKGLVQQFSSQIGELRRFSRDLDSVESLQGMLESERMKVHKYQQRLENIQSKINRQKEQEAMWKQQASRRVRLLWGLLSILVILWLLATANNEHEVEGPGLIAEAFQLEPASESVNTPKEEL